MAYTLGQAARATGKSKPTIARAIAKGRLSASRDETGAYVIDPAELHRVYAVPVSGNGHVKQSVPGEPAGTSLEALHVERDLYRALAEEREATIRDLRARLDAEAEERRRVQERLTGLLTHRRPGSVPPAGGAVVRQTWWRRWFR
jgi:hypothetical protein